MKKGTLRVSAGFKQFVLDQLEEVGEISSRSMFGGVGLYHAGTFFGILAGDTLYLKVDKQSREVYERQGLRPFRPFPGRQTSMNYYEVPLAVLESAPELAQWVKRSVQAARTSRDRPRPRRR